MWKLVAEKAEYAKERTLGNYMPNVVKGESVHWEEFRYTVKYQASIVIVDQLL